MLSPARHSSPLLATANANAVAGTHEPDEPWHADVWHAHTLAAPVAQVVATGEAVLDAQLPGGGWPVGALTELLQAPAVHAEWRLFGSALARSGTAAVVLVAPPHVPFGPSLAAQGVAGQRLLWVQAEPAQRLWAAEQALRCAGVDAVLAWLPQARPEQLRRLQMAAAQYHRLLFVIRTEAALHESSPAALRLWLPSADAYVDADADADASLAAPDLQVHILKRRGPPLAHALALPACTPALARLLAAARSQAHAHTHAADAPPGSPYVLDRAAA